MVVVIDRTWSGCRRHRRHDVVVVVVDATRDVVVVVVVDTTWGGHRPHRPRHDVVMVVLMLAFGWPRCRRAAYARVWLATLSSSHLCQCLVGCLGVGCFASQWGRGGLGGSEVVDWCGVAEMEGGSQVSGGVETVIKTRYETQLRHVSSRDAPPGPPTSWVPPGVFLPDPSVEPCRNGPHPSGEGRGTEEACE